MSRSLTAQQARAIAQSLEAKRNAEQQRLECPVCAGTLDGFTPTLRISQNGAGPRYACDTGCDPQLIAAAIEAAAPSQRDEAGETIVDGATFVLGAPDHVPAVWGHDGAEVIWPEDEYLLVTGPVGVGKTTIVQQVIRARLGLADEVLGYAVKASARNVLLLALDRPAQIARSMKRMFGEGDQEVLERRLKVVTAGLGDVIADPAYLARLVERNDADSLIVDALKDTATPLTDDVVGSSISTALRRAVAAGAQTVAVHHHRKATGENKKPSMIDDVYGSKWITAGAGSVVCIWGQPSDLVVELLHLKAPAEDVGPLKRIHDHRAGRTTLHEHATVRDLFVASDLTSGITAPDIARIVYDKAKPTANEIEKVRRKLERYVEEGFARRTECAKPDPTLYHRTERCA
jgi:replicative DNA helicase